MRFVNQLHGTFSRTGSNSTVTYLARINFLVMVDSVLQGSLIAFSGMNLLQELFFFRETETGTSSLVFQIPVKSRNRWVSVSWLEPP